MSANDLSQTDLSAIDSEPTGHPSRTGTTGAVGDRRTAEYATMRRVMNRFA